MSSRTICRLRNRSRSQLLHAVVVHSGGMSTVFVRSCDAEIAYEELLSSNGVFFGVRRSSSLDGAKKEQAENRSSFLPLWLQPLLCGTLSDPFLRHCAGRTRCSSMMLLVIDMTSISGHAGTCKIQEDQDQERHAEEDCQAQPHNRKSEPFAPGRSSGDTKGNQSKNPPGQCIHDPCQDHRREHRSQVHA